MATSISARTPPAPTPGASPRIFHPAQPRRALLAHGRIRSRDTPRSISWPMLAGGGRKFAPPQVALKKLASRPSNSTPSPTPRRIMAFGASKPVARRDKEEALITEIGHQILLFQGAKRRICANSTAPNARAFSPGPQPENHVRQSRLPRTRLALSARPPHLSARYHETTSKPSPRKEILAVARRYFHHSTAKISFSLVPQTGKSVPAAALAREAPGRPVPQFISLGAFQPQPLYATAYAAAPPPCAPPSPAAC